MHSSPSSDIQTVSNCPVCSRSTRTSEHILTDSIEIAGRDYLFTVDVCPNCGVMYSKKRSVKPDLYTKKHDIERAHGHQTCKEPILPQRVWNHRTKTLQTEELSGALQGTSRVLYLEIGASDGILYQMLRHELRKSSVTLNAVLVESSGAAEYCQQINGCQVYSADFLSDDVIIDNDSFDIAVLSHCLEHFPQPRNVLSKVWAALSDNALLFIEVPDGIRVDRSIAPPLGYYHVINFNLINLCWLIEQCGFKIMDAETRDHYPGIRVIARKKRPPSADTTVLPSLSYIWTRNAINQWQRAVRKTRHELHRIEAQRKHGKLLIYGCGLHTKAVIHHFPHWIQPDISDLTDSNPDISTFMERQTIPPRDIEFRQYAVVLISSYAYQEEIYEHLKGMGCPEKKIAKLYDSIFSYVA